MNRFSGLIFAAAMALTACDNTPDHVIKPRDMAELLADIHKSEGVIDLNGVKYRADSTRRSLKASVFERHGVTEEQFDTSLIYYGHNLEKYIEVYDATIEILQKELTAIDAISEGERVHVAVVGDSADAWSDSRTARFSANMPSEQLRFALRSDENSEKGDLYTWRFYLTNAVSPLRWVMAADYTDGSVDYIYSTAGSEGWQQLALQTDSAKSLRNLRGYVMCVPGPEEVVWLDSISVIRTRFNSPVYRRDGVHEFTNGLAPH